MNRIFLLSYIVKNKFYIDPKWKVACPNRWVGDGDFKTGKGTTWNPPPANSTIQLYSDVRLTCVIIRDLDIKKSMNLTLMDSQSQEICHKSVKLIEKQA